MTQSLTLADIIAAIIMIALTAYALLAGADFGGGVWDLLASGPTRDAQRKQITEAIGPIWEANHVWLIIAVVMLFTCFPAAFAELAIALHIPLSLVLIGIVLRGSAFAFRSYGHHDSAGEAFWGRVFAGSSLITPILLGVTVGAIASGRVRFPVVGASFAENYIQPWATPFGLAVGLLALALFAFLAAVYLTVEAAGQRPLQEAFRARALAAAAAAVVIAGLALLIARAQAPYVGAGLTTTTWALVLHIATGCAAIAAISALILRRYPVARLAAAAQVAGVLWGWGLAQYPFMIPPSLSIDAAAAPRETLRLVLIALIVGAAVLFPSLFYLFRVFKGSLLDDSVPGSPGSS